MPKALGVGNKQWLDGWEAMDRQVSQDDASYDPVGGITNGGTQACANCNWFVEPGACVLVRGDISPTGTSNLWMAEQEYVQEPIPVTIVAGEAASDDGLSMGKIVSGLVARVKAVFGTKEPTMVWSLKEMDDGRLRFFCAPTNCFQDREGDIFTTVAHKEYVEWADNKQFYPELWVWHTPGTRFGQVDWMDVSDGVLVASGLIDEGKESLAQSFKSDDGMSHGYIFADRGEGVIDKYWAYELSVVPRTNAMNIGTAFNLVEGLEMAFGAAKKSYLKDKLGADDATIAQWEKGSEDLAQSMKNLGIAWKSDDEAAVEQVVAAEAFSNEQILTEITSQNQQIITALSAITGKLVEVEGVATKASKSLDDAVADSMRSTAATLPQGSAASGRKDNVIEEAQAKPQLDWFGNIMDRVGEGVGV